MKKINGYLIDKFYKHFDAPLKLRKKVLDPETGKRKYLQLKERIDEISRYVENPQNIISRSFFPFIGFTIEERRSSKLSGLSKDGNGSIVKKRPIRYASHKDSAIYAYYANLLYPLYENKLRDLDLQDVVIAYRKSEFLYTENADNIHLAYDVFNDIKKRKNNCVALAFDIKSFYDNIDHKKLKEEWIKLLGDKAKNGQLPQDHYKIYKMLTDYCYIQRKAIEVYLHCGAPEKLHKFCEKCKTPTKCKIGHQIFKNMDEFHKFKVWYAKHPEVKLWDLSDEELQHKENILSSNKTFNFNVGILDKEPYGIPQGSSLSALLANIYMIPFDLEMKKYAQSMDATYRRYSDDIIFVCDKKYEKIATDEIPLKIKERGNHLIIHKIDKKDKNSKSKCYDFTSPDIKKRPLQYLGLEFDGDNIKIRGSSLARYLRKSKRGITAMRVSVQRKILSLWNKGENIDKILPKVYRKTLYRRYTHLGKRNFLSYIYKAYDHTGCKVIKKPLKRHFSRIKELIFKTDQKLINFYQKLNQKRSKLND